MINNYFLLSRTKKLQLLVAAAVFLLVLIYQMAIKSTLDVYSRYNSYQENYIGDIKKEDVIGVEKQLEKLNKRLNSEAENKEYLRRNLLSFIVQEVKRFNLNLVEVPEVSIQKVDDFELVINKFGVEGGFENLNKLLFNLESNQNFGRVVNATIKKVRNRITKKDQVILTVYVQSIIFNKDEKDTNN